MHKPKFFDVYCELPYTEYDKIENELIDIAHKYLQKAAIDTRR